MKMAKFQLSPKNRKKLREIAQKQAEEIAKRILSMRARCCSHFYLY